MNALTLSHTLEIIEEYVLQAVPPATRVCILYSTYVHFFVFRHPSENEDERMIPWFVDVRAQRVHESGAQTSATKQSISGPKLHRVQYLDVRGTKW